MSETENKIVRNPLLLAFLLFCLLFSIYLLTYNGVPLSDDEHLFAAVAQNLTITNQFQADQLSGNLRLLGRYNDIGPLHPLIGSLVVWLMKPFRNLGAVQGLYFLSPLYTALSAALLYLYTQQKGYTIQTGMFATLAFGLTTIAWPYAQTFYREPLAMLFFLAAYLLFERLIENRSPPKTRPWAWAVWGIFLLAAVLTKVYFILSVPLFLIQIFRNRKNHPKEMRRNFWPILGWGVLALAAIWLLAEKLNIQAVSRLNRSFFLHGLEILSLRVNSFQWLPAIRQLLGVFFSPAKGFFIYTPVTFFGAAAFFLHKKGKTEHPLIPLGTFFAFVVVQLFAYRDTWWNISWSTRFLLPVLPLVFILLLPLFEFTLKTDKLWPKIGLWTLTIVGFLIQIGGVLISDSVYLAQVYARENILDIGETVWRFDLMPALYHWKMLFWGEAPSLAITRNFSLYPALISSLILVLLVLIGYLSFALFRISSRKSIPEPIYSRIFRRFLSVYLLLLLPIFLLIGYRSDPIYFASWEPLQAAVQRLEQEVTADDVVVVAAYQTPAWYYLMNFGRLSTPWYSLPEQSIGWQKTLQTIGEENGASQTVFLLIPQDSVIIATNMLQSLYPNCDNYYQFEGPMTLTYVILVCN
ncbi:hypothetical protein KQH54_00460 [bacterium]|nr:hypothetical protein [bacterium]